MSRRRRRTTVPLRSIAVISDYQPRQCGIATFTTDLRNAIGREMDGPGDQVEVVAMDDVPEGYAYPPCVKFQVRANNQADYLRAADFINVNQYDVALIQHEYGIYGGEDGAYILRLIRELRMPVNATLHTVLAEPTKGQRAIMRELGKLCEKLVVMSQRAVRMLRDIYDVPEQKVMHIHHGIPDRPFSDPRFFKDQFNLADRKVVLTFGLLSPNKGIEGMIDAMEQVVQVHDDAVYVVLGATHPHVLRQTGDAYRASLQQRVRKAGLGDHVIFKNEFVELETLCEYLAATDVYVTPYLNEAQITSGTLAYAMGTGTAIVSTPYWYAEEMLADGRGHLVPFRDIDVLADGVTKLLSDEEARHACRRKAYEFTRAMVWPEVARRYIELGEDVLAALADHPKARAEAAPPVRLINELPEINLQHLHTLTDDTGILQHATYSTPDRSHGYCTDDNARALIAAAMYHNLRHDDRVVPLMHVYLSFLHHAINRQSHRFRNFMTYDRRWLEQAGSEDSHGRALWGLGCMVRHGPHDGMRDLATRLFTEAMGVVGEFTSPRAWAFSLIGLHEYLAMFGGDSEARRIRNELAVRLHRQFAEHASDDWPWLEDIVAYANAKLPHALLLAGQWIPDPAMYQTGLRVLRWLLEVQSAPDGHISFIGSEKWMTRDGQRSHFAQQPIEAMAMIEACVEAFRSSGDQHWLDAARRCFSWFLGDNDLSVPICDFKTGGCHDGLELYGPNQNQGAESSLAWLIALLTMHQILGQEVLVDERGLIVHKPDDAVATDEADPVAGRADSPR